MVLKQDIDTMGNSTINSLAPKYHISKTLAQRQINLVIDTTYFGRSFGYMIFRAHGINLYYQQVDSETIEGLGFGLDVLDTLGYTFKSITIDGRTGFIKSVTQAHRYNTVNSIKNRL